MDRFIEKYHYKLSVKQILVGCAIIFYILVNIFRIGGNEFLFELNRYMTPIVSVVIVVQLFFIRLRMEANSQNRNLWTGMFIGWLFWAVAETWWGIASALGSEMPFPSGADVLWLVGYLPMFYALVARYQSIPKTNIPGHKMILSFLSILAVGLTVIFIFVPIVKEFDPTLWVESVLNIFYPLADLILLILVLQILFKFQGGLHGRAWIWLSLAFLLLAFSDLVFSYATIYDLYYPEGELNFLSTVVIDTTYNISYLLVVVGLYYIGKMHKSYQTLEETVNALPVVPNTHILLFTDSNDLVTDVSPNSAPLLQNEIVRDRIFSQVLKITPDNTDALLSETRANKVLHEREVTVSTKEGLKKIKLSGEAIYDQMIVYSGSIFLARMCGDDPTGDKLLSDYQKGIVKSIMEKAGARANEANEIKTLFSGYYAPQFRALFNQALTEGGSSLADAFLAELRAIARQNDWQIGLHPYNLLDMSLVSVAQAQQALPVLFENAKKIVGRIADEAAVNSELEKLQARFDDATRENVAYFLRASV